MVDLKKNNKWIANLSEVKNHLDNVNSKWSDTLDEIIQYLDRESFEHLKSLFFSDKWPKAVDEVLVCDDSSEDDKLNRAQGIVNLVLPPLNRSKFLDVGCGEGHCVVHTSNTTSKSVGFDIRESGEFSWEEDNGYLLTTDWSKVVENGPYDVVLIYDVVDHIEKEKPNELFSKVNNVLNDKGEVYLRCHPWCSRHGVHQYRSHNKAFAHLVFNESECAELEIKNDYPVYHHTVHPILTYGSWIEGSGLKVKQKQIENEQVEPFFKNDEVIASRIKRHWVDSHEKDLANGTKFPNFQLQQAFLTFILVKK